MIFVSFCGTVIAAAVISHLYMKYRARKVYEYVWKFEGSGLDLEKIHEMMRKFWKWPIRFS